MAALIGAAAGQFLRRALTHRRFNQFGVTVLVAAPAGAVYGVAAAADAVLGTSNS